MKKAKKPRKEKQIKKPAIKIKDILDEIEEMFKSHKATSITASMFCYDILLDLTFDEENCKGSMVDQLYEIFDRYELDNTLARYCIKIMEFSIHQAEFMKQRASELSRFAMETKAQEAKDKKAKEEKDEDFEVIFDGVK